MNQFNRVCEGAAIGYLINGATGAAWGVLVSLLFWGIFDKTRGL